MKRSSGKLRIIGGAFRSRLVDFDPAAGVRPTPDRVRQTLFDWLTPIIDGARCLDLFAGSGAIGLEALSRGAAHVTFVESGAAQAAAIRAALEKLGVSARAEVIGQDALAFLASPIAAMGRSHTGPDSGSGSGSGPGPGPGYDVAFLDPPFDSELLAPALVALPRVLKPQARVYAEWQRAAALPWPAGYEVIREKKAGQVSYALATYDGTAGSPA